MEKLRTIITQDAEVDDQNSLRHLLFYANEVEIEGIIQTSSRFHWAGTENTNPAVPGPTVSKTEAKCNEKPYRWTGYQWMWEVLDAYEVDYPKLSCHSSGYPSPEYLRSVTKIGNISFGGEIDKPSEGSELIRKAILKEDKRTLYIQMWGGMNTVARALFDIEHEYRDTDEWESIHHKISERIVFLACGQQDNTYKDYIAEVWPDIACVEISMMESYAYAWKLLPESDSRDTLDAPFMQKWIVNRNSELMKNYCTWFDGQFYPGEELEGQFGSGKDIKEKWFGNYFHLPDPEKGEFISEGDSPTFLGLVFHGFRFPENLGARAFCGRFIRTEMLNSKGESVNYWKSVKEEIHGKNGENRLGESMFPFTAMIQRDFAARIGWASNEENPCYPPSVEIAEGYEFTGFAGEEMTLHLSASSNDAGSVLLNAELDNPVSVVGAEISLSGNELKIMIPTVAKSGDQISVIICAKSNDTYQLSSYRYILINVA